MAYEDGVFATFYNDAIKNDFKTKKEGFPVFDDVLMIRIQIPNSTDCVPRPATEADKRRFPRSWEAYETGSAPVEDGFPLSQWPQITAGELKILEANQIKTVEQLADLPDSGIHRLGQGGHSMKNRAVKFIKSQGETSELRKENKELRKKNEDLEARLEKLEAMAEAQVPDAESEGGRRRFTG